MTNTPSLETAQAPQSGARATHIGSMRAVLLQSLISGRVALIGVEALIRENIMLEER
jgi:hypothetical protein